MVALEKEIARQEAKPKKNKKRIEQLKNQRKGLAGHKNWWTESPVGFRRSKDEENPEPEQEDHVLPSCKTFCSTLCGCCPCLIDDHEVKDAKAALEQLQKQEGSINQQKLIDANAAVTAAEEALAKVRQTKLSQSMGILQTAVVTPCMLGM
jgi:hypothetical protein